MTLTRPAGAASTCSLIAFCLNRLTISACHDFQEERNRARRDRGDSRCDSGRRWGRGVPSLERPKLDLLFERSFELFELRRNNDELDFKIGLLVDHRDQVVQLLVEQHGQVFQLLSLVDEHEQRALYELQLNFDLNRPRDGERRAPAQRVLGDEDPI